MGGTTADAASPRDTLRRLRQAQKPPHGTAAYSRFVNRPAGRVIATGAYHLGLSPNTVSLISGAVTATGIAVVALAPPHPAVSILAGLLLALGYAIDSADGQVARLTGRSSRLGEWLDHILDAAKMQSIHLAVLVHLFRWYDAYPQQWLLLPLAFSIVGNVLYFGMILIDQLRRSAGGSGNRPGANSLSLVVALALLPMDYGTLAVVIGTLAWPPIFLTLYGALALGTLLALVAALRKWVNELRQADRGA